MHYELQVRHNVFAFLDPQPSRSEFRTPDYDGEFEDETKV